MKNNSKDDSKPRAYIKEKYKNKILIESYAPRSIPIKELQNKLGIEEYLHLGGIIDKFFNTHF